MVDNNFRKQLDSFQDLNIIKNQTTTYKPPPNSGQNLYFDDTNYKQILTEYYKLTTLEELSEQDAQLLDRILELAETDETLSFLLNEVDEMTFQELGFYGHKDLDYWSNQKAKTKEFIINPENNLEIGCTLFMPSISEDQDILTEYYKLATLEELSEQDAQCLDKILQLAEKDERLSLLLNEIDDQTFEKLGFYEQEKLENNNRHQTETVKNIIDSRKYKVPFNRLLQEIFALITGFKDAWQTVRKTVYEYKGIAYDFFMPSATYNLDKPVEYIELTLKGKGTDFLEGLICAINIDQEPNYLDSKKLFEHPQSNFKNAYKLLIVFLADERLNWIKYEQNGQYKILKPHLLSQWLNDNINHLYEEEAMAVNAAKIRINSTELNPVQFENWSFGYKKKYADLDALSLVFIAV